MKLKLAFTCAAVCLLWALAFLFFSLGDSDRAAWIFLIVTAVAVALLSIINSFVCLYVILKK